MPDAANTPSAPPVPDAALDRFLEAMWRSRKYLSAEKQRKIDELWNLDTFVAFGFLVLVWAGFQFTPIGWIADAALAAYGAYQIGGTLLEFLGAAKDAAYATTDQALELAAKQLAHAMSDAVVDIIAAILGAAAFGRLRGLLRSWRGKILPKNSRWLDAERAPKVVEEPGRGKLAEPAKPKISDYAIGAAQGVGLQAGSVALGGVNPWPWVAGVATVLGLVLVVAGLASSSSSSSSARRWSYAA